MGGEGVACGGCGFEAVGEVEGELALAVEVGSVKEGARERYSEEWGK